MPIKKILFSRKKKGVGNISRSIYIYLMQCNSDWKFNYKDIVEERYWKMSLATKEDGNYNNLVFYFYFILFFNKNKSGKEKFK